MSPPYRAVSRGGLNYHKERYDSLIEDRDLAKADRVACYMLAVVWSCGVAGVEGAPHSASYIAHDITKPAQRTVPFTVVVNKDDPKPKRRADTLLKDTEKTVTVSNTEAEGSAAHWLKERSMRQLDIQLDCVAAAYVGDRWYLAANNLVIIDSDAMEMLRELGTPNALYKIVWDPTPNLHAEMKILKHLRTAGVALAGIDMGVSKPCCNLCKRVLDEQGVAYTSYHGDAVDPSRWAAPF